MNCAEKLLEPTIFFSLRKCDFSMTNQTIRNYFSVTNYFEKLFDLGKYASDVSTTDKLVCKNLFTL